MDHNTFALLDDQMDGYMSKFYRISKNHMLISIGKNTIKIMRFLLYTKKSMLLMKC